MTFTLYISGQMMGKPDYNYQAFNRAADQLRAAGYSIENPAENPPGLQRHEYMRMDYGRLERSDAIATLDDHHYSPGASSEIDKALNLNMPIAPVQWWVQHRDNSTTSTTSSNSPSTDSWIKHHAEHLHYASASLGFFCDAMDEHIRASAKHPAMRSAHEAYAILLEEVEEYWAEVRKRDHDHTAMYAELVQIAAMAGRAACDLAMNQPAVVGERKL